MSVGGLTFFGIPTTPSTIEDGHLTLGKALTLPRVSGHTAGAETPRAESLAVCYDTTVDYVVSGTTVLDISNERNNGTLKNGAAYSSADRAFTFDGSDDYILDNSPSGMPTGDAIYSMSAWVNIYTYTPTSTILAFGSAWTCSTIGDMYINDNGQLSHSIGCHQVYTTNQTITTNTWHHTVVVKKGTGANSAGNIDLYVDGLLITDKTVNGTGTQNIGTASFVTVGAGSGPTELFNGKISKPKIWNVALTAEEVAMEYALGRTGKSLNLTDTALCIGGIVPKAQLDVRGKIRAASGSISTFTGQHRCSSAQGPLEKGLVVSALQNKYMKLNGDLSTGPTAITIDESLPVVSLSNVAQDKACFGVVSRMEEMNTLFRVDTTTGGLISETPKVLGDNRVIVNSVGEGAMWVTDTNGPLESGDYITTSNVAGYGQKQDSDSLKNYTVAKITMDCDFNPQDQPIQVIKKDEDGVNVLDEHGQLQWEEHPTETEKAYKIRYLDASGAQTDEANTVHIAAFVGCTYHCG